MPTPNENGEKRSVWFYNDLKNRNYDVGDYSSFKEHLSNDNDRRQLYDMLTADEYKNLPSYEDFSSQLGYGAGGATASSPSPEEQQRAQEQREAAVAKGLENTAMYVPQEMGNRGTTGKSVPTIEAAHPYEKPQQEQPQQPQQTETSEEVGRTPTGQSGTDVGSGHSDVNGGAGVEAPAEQPVAEAQVEQPTTEAPQVEEKAPEGGGMTEQQRLDMSMRLFGMQMGMQQQAAENQRIAKNLEKRNKLSGVGRQTVVPWDKSDGGLVTTMENGTKVYILPDGDTTENRTLAKSQEYEYQKRNRLIQASSIDNQLRRLQETAKSGEEERARETRAENAPQSGLEQYLDRTSGVLPTGMSVGDVQTRAMLNDADFRRYNIVDRGTGKLQDLIKEAQRKGNTNFFAGAWRGFVQSVGDRNTWTFGMDDADEAALTYDVIKKWDKGERLTASEQALFDYVALSAAVMGEYGEDLGKGYKAGQTTGQSLPFMVEMLVNPAAGFGEAAAKRFANYAVKRFERQIVSSARRRAGTMLLKGGTMASRGIGDALGAGIMNATTGMPQVVANTAERMAGSDFEPTMDQNTGKITLKGHKEGLAPVEAFEKAFTSQWLERYSEMVGAYFEPGTRFISGTIMKGLEKNGLKAAMGMIERFRAGNFYKGFKNITERTKWNGVVEEYAEEVVNNIGDALLVGDQTFDTDKDTGVWNLDRNIETFLGVSLMSMFFTSVNMAGMGWDAYNGPTRRAGKLVRTLEQTGYTEWGADRQRDWLQYINAVKSGDETTMKEAITNVVTNRALTTEQKRVALQYASATMQSRGADMAEEELYDEGAVSETEQLMTGAFNIGYDLATNGNSQDWQDVKAARDAAIEQLDKQGLTTELLEQIKENPYGALTNLLARVERGEASQELYNAVSNFIQMNFEYKGLQVAYDDNVNSKVMESNAQVDDITRLGPDGKLSGEVRSVKLLDDDEDYYLVSGTPWVRDDGSVDVDRTKGLIILKSGRDGTTFAVDPEDIERVDAPQESDKLKVQRAQQIQDEAAKVWNDAVNPQTEDEEGGDEGQGGGNADNGGTPGGNPSTGQGGTNGGTNGGQGGGTSATPNLNLVPKDENGNPLYEQAPSARVAYLAILEQCGGDEEMAEDIVQEMYSEAEEALDEAKAMEPRDANTVAEKIAARKEVKEAIERAQKNRDFWDEVSDMPGTITEEREAEEERKRKEDEEQKKLEEERRRQEEERKKKAEEEAKRKAEEERKRKEAEEKRKAEAEAKRKAAEEAKKKETEKPKNEGAIGIASDARVEEIKRRIAEKIGGRLNAGWDPELMALGMELAAAYIDRGIKTFADFARVMIRELGDAIRPYLKSFYESARNHPDLVAAGVGREMTPVAEVQEFDVNNFDREDNNEDNNENEGGNDNNEDNNEGEPTEAELLDGVPDYTRDNEKAARKRGYRNENGHVLRRQEPITNKVEGSEVTVAFSANGVQEKGHLVLIDVGDLQSSHHLTQRNLKHFLGDAQPKLTSQQQIKDRAVATQQHAQAIDTNQIVSTPKSSKSAYDGAPVVNSRGEAIQGNGRADVLRVMYAEHPEQAEKYKQYLRENAADFGLTAEDVDKMENPVLVRMLDVDDDRAVVLGQYDSHEMESGGQEAIDPAKTAAKLGDKVSVFADVLLKARQHRDGTDYSLDELLDANGMDALKYLSGGNPTGTHYISQSQVASAVNADGSIRPEAKRALRDVLFRSMFGDVDASIEQTFYSENFPDRARKALLATLYKDFKSPKGERLMPFVVEALRAYGVLIQLKEFRSCNNLRDAFMIVEENKNQGSLFSEGVVLEGFSNFALDLAALFKCMNQVTLRNTINEIFSSVQGDAQPSMFGDEGEVKTLADAVRDELNTIKQGLNIKPYEESGSSYVGITPSSSEGGGQGSSGSSRGGEPGTGEVQGAVGTTGAGGLAEGTGAEGEVGGGTTNEGILGGGRYETTEGSLAERIVAVRDEITLDLKKLAERVAQDLNLKLEKTGVTYHTRGYDGVAGVTIRMKDGAELQIDVKFTSDSEGDKEYVVPSRIIITPKYNGQYDDTQPFKLPSRNLGANINYETFSNSVKELADHLREVVDETLAEAEKRKNEAEKKRAEEEAKRKKRQEEIDSGALLDWSTGTGTGHRQKLVSLAKRLAEKLGVGSRDIEAVLNNLGRGDIHVDTSITLRDGSRLHIDVPLQKRGEGAGSGYVAKYITLQIGGKSVSVKVEGDMEPGMFRYASVEKALEDVMAQAGVSAEAADNTEEGTTGESILGDGLYEIESYDDDRISQLKSVRRQLESDMRALAQRIMDDLGLQGKPMDVGFGENYETMRARIPVGNNFYVWVDVAIDVVEGDEGALFAVPTGVSLLPTRVGTSPNGFMMPRREIEGDLTHQTVEEAVQNAIQDLRAEEDKRRRADAEKKRKDEEQKYKDAMASGGWYNWAAVVMRDAKSELTKIGKNIAKALGIDEKSHTFRADIRTGTYARHAYGEDETIAVRIPLDNSFTSFHDNYIEIRVSLDKRDDGDYKITHVTVAKSDGTQTDWVPENGTFTYKELEDAVKKIKNAKTEEKSGGKVGKNEKKDVTSQTEERELTKEEVDSAEGIDPTIRTMAKAWIDGQKNAVTENAYQLVKQYVRSQSGNSASDSGNANGAHVGGEANGPTSRGSGQSGNAGGRVGNEGSGEAVPRNGGRGANSTTRVATSSGRGGNRGVSNGESSLFGSDSGAVSSGASSERNGAGASVQNRGQGQKGSNRVSKTNATGQGEAERGRDTADSIIDDALGELKDILKNPFKMPGDEGNNLYSAIPFVSALGVNGIRVMAATVKLGYGYVLKGYYKFVDWKAQMSNSVYPLLKNATKAPDEDIDRFIVDMWDSPFEVNGEVKNLSDWAKQMELQQLRDMVHKTKAEKRKAQLAQNAKKVPVQLANIDNIREALPFLLPAQQEDVQKAETQFFDESHNDKAHAYGKGYMFTNGTGTGKTYTGAGIVKRFIDQGKKRILIVTANGKKISDWVNDVKDLGIEATALQNTKDRGKGVSVTQYADLYQNFEIYKDEFDLIVYDESHKLMENKLGQETATTHAHFLLSNRDVASAIERTMVNTPLWVRDRVIDDEVKKYAKLLEDYNKEQTFDLEQQISNLGGVRGIENKITQLRKEQQELRQRQQEALKEAQEDEAKVEKAKKDVEKTKVVFLSATPFNTAMSLDYAEGYIFTYPSEEGRQRERAELRNDFLMNTFGSSYVRGKDGRVGMLGQTGIADPEAASEEEIAFSNYLQETLNTMSGRALDSEWDYSREFPKVDFPEADLFNKAVDALSRGKYSALKDYFKMLFDYNTQTAFFEIIKADQAIERAKQHIAQGRKVVIFHRRLNTKVNIYRPFADGLAAAAASGVGKDLSALIKEFRGEYAELLDWESRLDYSFPHEKVMNAFASAEEQRKFQEAFAAWTLTGKGKEPKIKSARVGAFNGSESERDRAAVVEAFNDDNSKMDVLIVQIQSGKEGISLHDTTGKKQRAQICISLPQSPIEFIQAEGRIYRVGNQSNAIFEYPLLGVDLELASFAMKINGRSQTTENLALGGMARGLRDSIARAALGSRVIPVQANMGTGGKALDDMQKQKQSGYDDALNNYAEWANGPAVDEGASFSYREVPDPIGYKMAEFGAPENGERAFVPDAGTGTVARYVSGRSKLWASEPRSNLFAKLVTLVGGSGRKVDDRELHSIPTSRSDVDVFIGRAEQGMTGFEMVNSGGRVVLLLKESEVSAFTSRVANNSATDKYTHTNLVAETVLPANVMKSDGEKVHILVYDVKKSPKEVVWKNGAKKMTDLSDIKDVNKLYQALRDVQAPPRDIDRQERVAKRVKKYIDKMKKIPFIAKSKDWSTGKMKADVFESPERLLLVFTRGSVTPPNAEEDGVSYMYRNFEISYKMIAENNVGYIMNLARAWIKYDDWVSGREEIPEGKVLRYKMSDKDKPAVLEAMELFRDTIADALGKNEMQIRNIAQGRSENRISGTMTIDEFRQAFDALNQEDAEMKALADKVFDTASRIEGMEIKVVPQSEMPNPNVVGLYTVRNGQSALWVSEEKFNSIKLTDDQKAATIVHELIHAVTTYCLDCYEKGATGWMSEEQKQACRDIMDVYKAISTGDDFKNYLRTHSKVTDNAEYGLTNAHEMVAEMSNPVFRAALKAKKLWRQLINGIKKVLGIDVTGEEGSETTAYDTLSHALDTLMDNFDSEAYNDWTSLYAGTGQQRARELPSERLEEDESAVVDNLAEKLHLDNVQVAESLDDVPESARTKKGYYNTRTGQITVVLPNNHSRSDVERTVLHEAVVHHGLRELFGDNFSRFLDGVYRALPESERGKINRSAAQNHFDFHTATEEYLGELCDGMDWEKNPSLWSKIRHLFHEMLRRAGFEHLIRLSDNDLRYILWKSRENLEGRGRGVMGAARDIAKQRELKVGDYEEEDLLFRPGDNDNEAMRRAQVRDAFEAKLRTGMYQTREAMLDHMASLKEAMELITKGKYKHVEDIPDALNPYLGENRLSSVNEAELDAFQAVVFGPLYAQVRKMAKTKEEREELVDYMMSKHGLERNEYMAQRDAEKEFEEYTKAHPNGKMTLDDFVKAKRKKDYAGLCGLWETMSLRDAEEAAEACVHQYEREYGADVDALWEQINRVNDAILSKSLETGLMSQEIYDYVKSMYQYYIPLRGFDERTSRDEYAYLPDRRDNFQKGVMKAHGRRSKADDPFANLEAMAASTIVEGNRNALVKQRFYNFVMQYPSDLVSVAPIWLYYNKNSQQWEAQFPTNINDDDSPEEVERKLKEWDEQMAANAEEDPSNYRHGREARRVPYKVITSEEMRQHQVIVRVGGDDYILTVNGNPRLAQAVNGKTNPDNEVTGSIGKILNVVGNVNRGISAIYTTLQPDFIVSNYMRDMIYSNVMTLVKESPTYAAQFTANCARFNPLTMFALLEMYRQNLNDGNVASVDSKTRRLFKEFMENGGETGYVRLMDIESIKKKLEKKFSKAFSNDVVKLIGEMGRGVEMAARFAAFVTSRNRGRDIARSIWDAKEVSVNFNKKGAGDKFLGKKGQTKAGNVASFVSGAGRALYIFWNASVQGTFNNFFKYGARHPMKFAVPVAGLFIWGMMKALTAAGGGGDDDDKKESEEYEPNYFDVPSYTRRSNIVVKGPKNTWLKYPLAIEMRTPYGLGELLGSCIARKEELTANAVMEQLMELSPVDVLEGQKDGEFSWITPVVPSAFKTWYEAEKNVSFSGVPIYKDTPFNKDMPAWTKAYGHTNKDLVNLSAFLNDISGGDNKINEKGKIDMNPAYVEYMLRGYVPFYTLENQLSNLAHDWFGDKEFDWRDVPLVNRVVSTGDETMHYRQVNNKYFKLKDEHDKLATKVKKYNKQIEKNDDVLKYAEKIDFLQRSKEYKRYKVFEDYRKDIDKYEKKRKEAEEPEEVKFWTDSVNILKEQLVKEAEEVSK